MLLVERKWIVNRRLWSGSWTICTSFVRTCFICRSYVHRQQSSLWYMLFNMSYTVLWNLLEMLFSLQRVNVKLNKTSVFYKPGNMEEGEENGYDDKVNLGAMINLIEKNLCSRMISISMTCSHLRRMLRRMMWTLMKRHHTTAHLHTWVASRAL